MISLCAATRPEPSLVLHTASAKSRADQRSDSIARTISSAAGNTSTMRPQCLMALEVQRAEQQLRPVSAAVSARRIVSRSRISPTRIAFNSRNAERSAFDIQRVRAHFGAADQAL
jgi:hypothetical protein